MGTSLGDVASERVAALTAREEEVFRSKRARSRELWKEARVHPARRAELVPGHAAAAGVHRSRRGSRVWDVDGNEYVDFHNGFGVMVGRPRASRDRRRGEAQIHRGIAFRAAGRGEHRRRARAGPPVPSTAMALHQQRHRVRRCDAVRLARGFTGREGIIKIEASYHGHHDALLVSVEPPVAAAGDAASPNSVPMTAGIPASTVALTIVVGFNDLDALERAFSRIPARSPA